MPIAAVGATCYKPVPCLRMKRRKSKLLQSASHVEGPPVGVDMGLSQKCDTLPWKFNLYVSETGACDTAKQIAKLSDEAEEHFRARVRYLANTPKLDWARPEAAKLKGVDDIYEIRFKANGLQHRPLGTFGPEAGSFTILIWAAKKGTVYDPSSAIETADKRAKALLAANATVRKLELDGEVFPPIEQEQEDEGGLRQGGIGQWPSISDPGVAQESWLESGGTGKTTDDHSGGGF